MWEGGRDEQEMKDEDGGDEAGDSDEGQDGLVGLACRRETEKAGEQEYVRLRSEERERTVSVVSWKWNKQGRSVFQSGLSRGQESDSPPGAGNGSG